jgi:hypothetical protein
VRSLVAAEEVLAGGGWVGSGGLFGAGDGLVDGLVDCLAEVPQVALT